MKTLKVIALIIAAGLIMFGVLFILAAFSPDAQGTPGGLIGTGIVLAGIGFVFIFIALKFLTPKAPEAPQQVNVKIDLPGNVNMETMKCKSCGGTLAPENIALMNGAPVVTCPFCKTTYQLTEEPKW